MRFQCSSVIFSAHENSFGHFCCAGAERCGNPGYAGLAHWQATREDAKLAGNGPDWEACRKGLNLRDSLTLQTNFMPALDETYQLKR